MKLVTRFKSEFEAEKASELLEQNGFATFVSNKRSVHLPMNRGGASHTALWVVVEAQLHDARSLLNDENHEVTNKLSVSELAEIKIGISNPDMTVALGFLFKALGIIAVVAIMVYYVTTG